MRELKRSLLEEGANEDPELQSEEDEEKSQKEKKHGFGELFIHQLIETIEFVLGTISNTASYLRLWALSLAHAQLAKVFFDNLMKPAIDADGFFSKIIMTFVAFVIFGSVTFGILMVMDVLECFLHTIRLHWVEF